MSRPTADAEDLEVLEATAALAVAAPADAAAVALAAPDEAAAEAEAFPSAMLWY